MNIKIINFDEPEINQLKQYITNNRRYIDKLGGNVVFVRIIDDSLKNRNSLREILSKYSDSLIIISSNNPEVSKLAWKINAFYYIDKAIDKKVLTIIFNKLSKLTFDKKQKIKLSYQGGFDLIGPDEICLIKAAGNYIELYLDGKKKKIYTYKLKDLEKILIKYPFLVRTGRSFIINMDKISKVEPDFVRLSCNPSVKLKLSKNYIKKIRAILLWYI